MIARDSKNDQFIADLKPEEIEIYEDGVKQKIASIELMHGGRAYSVQAPPPAPVQEGIILPRNKPTNDTAGRVFIIFIDDLHLDFRQTPRTRKLLQDMLKNLIHDGDMFGITTPARRRCRCSSPTTGRCSIRGVARSPATRSSRRKSSRARRARTGPTELRHRAHVAFSTAYDLMKNLEKLQNRRKAVIYISSGYDFNPFEKGRLEETARRWHVDNADDLQSDPFDRNQQSSQTLAEADLVRELAELTRAANRANATMYTIDPRGLVAGQDIDEEVDIQDWNAYLRESQDSLRVLAEQTGGIAVVNQNDFNKALKKIDDETSDYYVHRLLLEQSGPAEAHAEARGQDDARRTSTSSRDVLLAAAAAADGDARVSRSAAAAMRARELLQHGTHGGLEPGPHRLGHLHHLRHHPRQAADLRVDPSGLPRQRVAGNAAAEELLAAHVVGRRLPRDDADAEPVAHHRLDDLDVLGLHHDVRLDALAGEELLDEPARDRAAFEQDERLLVEIGGRDLASCAQRVRRVGDEQQLLLEERHRDEVGGVDRQGDEAEVARRPRAGRRSSARRCRR